MIWFLVFFGGVMIFSFVIAFGAPFLPTLKNRNEDVFKLLDLRPGQTMLELGSGDGRILLMAAQKGIKAIGYELNPLLVIYSRIKTWKYRRLVSVHCRNYWQVKFPPTDGIYVFLLQPYMEKLDKKIIQEISKPVKLVSFAFHIPNRKPNNEINGMFLYKYK
jgi:SAM-dependent methyltransferase